jgi:hypothetical protein
MKQGNYTELESEIIEVCKKLVVQLRGNQAGNGKALINLELISVLHKKLESYETILENQELVNKDVVGLLLYTCTRFYLQSKYSNNSPELLKQFDKLSTKLLDLYFI